MGDAFTPIAGYLLVDDDPYQNNWNYENYSEPPAVFRDQVLSAHLGVIFRVCNGYVAGLFSDLQDLIKCITQTVDISTSQAPDTRGPIIDLVEVTPTSIDPGDVVTATLRLRDVSGIGDADGGYFNARFDGPNHWTEADLSVSLTEEGAETVAILQATWPASEFGCGEFLLWINASDSLGNQSSFTYTDPIDVSCAIPETTATTVAPTTTFDLSDVDGPEISFVSISPTTASAGDEVTVTLSISDPTGVESGYVQLQSQALGTTGGTVFMSNTNFVLVSGDATNGTYEATLTVSNVPGGVFRLYMQATDDLSNSNGETVEDVLTLEGPS